MKIPESEHIKELAVDLVSQQSIVDTPDEIKMAEKIYNIFAGMDYYKKHPENLYYVDCKDDALGRKVVVAEMNGEKGDSKKTVAMIGHFDTVGISDYGPLAEYNTKPYELAEKFKGVKLPPEAQADLESGDYLFGRGLFDMKSGDAIIIAMMEEIAKDIENFEGNLVYGAVCDEEGNSGGMLNLVPKLVELKKTKGYDYQALLDPDYVAPAYPGDPLKYVYIGTVGKIMPTFYIFGKETHVGESFDGLDPNQIAAALTSRINLNPEFSDTLEGEVTLPPITLKQRDLKPEYSVQIANKAVVMFNFATHSWTPDIVLKKMKDAGQECFQEVVDTLNERYHKYCDMVGREFKPQPWVARTMTYSELYAAVKAEKGEQLDKDVAALKEKLKKDNSIDARDKDLQIVDFVHDQWSDHDPVLITFITQPYYPHVFVDGAKAKDAKLIDSVKKAVAETEPNYDYDLRPRKFLPCISDLSYGAAPKEKDAIDALKENEPGYGTLYELPLEDMAELDLPVADIGSFGKDAHKFTERVDMKATYEVTASLFVKTVENLLK
ncbi:MAG: M20/M25/M40 family metallo-hydrolase [Anaerovoracaceae bacterium]|jgi:arginine utilization protein RocB